VSKGEVMMERVKMAEGYVYHIYSKSIADYKIFNSKQDYIRILEVIKYYKNSGLDTRFSKSEAGVNLRSDNLLSIIAFCIMPTHVHFICRQIKVDGISTFMRKILNSYTKYLNIKYKRKGPLWESRFKRVIVESDEQLLHLTRYIHLNPVTAYLVNKAQDWQYSSYNEYIGEANGVDNICDFKGLLDIEKEKYQLFVEDNVSYQRELAKIKSLLIE